MRAAIALLGVCGALSTCGAASAAPSYFVPGPAGELKMRGSGFSCPSALADLPRDAVEVLDERPEALDLSCHYSGHDVTVTVFVTRYPNADFQDLLGHAEDVLRQDADNVRPIPLPVALLGPGRFDAGKCWRSGPVNSCIAFRRQGDFVIQARLNYDGADGTRTTRDAVRALMNHAFQRGTVGR